MLGPTFQHPLINGADLAIYSATKFLGGFSDLLAGAVLAADPELIQTLTGVRALLGNILQADECWMLDSRLSTVALRMNRQSKNAQRIAEQLAKHPRVKRVIYPSLFTDAAQIQIRDAQTDYPGSLLSLEVEGGKTGGVRISAPSEDREERRQPGRRRNSRVPSDDDDAQRAVGRGIVGRRDQRVAGAHLGRHRALARSAR